MTFLKKHKVVIGIFLLALVVRGGLFLINFHGHGWNFEDTIHGQDGFFEVGRNIAAGTGFTWDGVVPTPVHMPLYPLFLAASLYFFGSYVVAAIVQILMGAFLAVFAMYISLKIVPSKKIALFVGVVMALDPYFALLSFTTFSETVFMFLFLLFVLSFMTYLEKRDTGTLAVSAILLGLSTLAKTSTQFFPVLLIPLMWWYLRKRLSTRRLLADSVLLVGIFFIVLLPWLYRNHVVFGHYDTTVMPTWNLYSCLVPSVLAVANDTNFAAEYQTFVGDGPLSLGDLTFATAPEYRARAMPIIYAHMPALVEVSAINVVTFFTHDGMLGVLGYAGIHPAVALSRPALSYLLSAPVAFFKESSGFLASPFVLVAIMRVFWILVTLSAALGAWILVWRKEVSPALAFAFVLVLYFAVTTMTNGLTVNVRFRMPIDPILLALTGVGIAYCYTNLKRRFVS